VRHDLVAVHNAIDPTHYLGRFWVDSLVHDPLALRFLVERMGVNKVCLGSDYPFPLGEAVPGKLIQEVYSDAATRNALLYQNAHRWLGFSSC
jgi:aminocarboxymuconate-semialdehyde decarboxylase